MRTIKNKLKLIHGLIGSAVLMLFLTYGGYVLKFIRYPWTSVITEILIAAIAFGVTFCFKADVGSIIPMKKVPVSKLIASFGMMLGTLRITMSINALAMMFFEDAGKRNEAITQSMRNEPLIISLIVTALLPAICEEIFFRGFVQTSAKSVGNGKFAVIISAALFGLLHLDLYSLIPITLLGILFGYVALKTESLMIPIMLHFFNNGLSTVMAHLSFGNTGETVSVSIWQQLLAIAVNLAIGATVTLVCTVWFNSKKENE